MPYSLCLPIFYPCDNHFNYNALGCGTACYIFESIAGITTWIISILGPLLIILFANLFLIMKVHQHKCLQYISWFPISLISAIDAISSTVTILELRLEWLSFGFIYFPVLCSPVMSIIALPELKNEIIQWIQEQRDIFNTRIHPMIRRSSVLQRML
ncbi:unnamed protein product [Rotaria sp. Silwood1]|nr:unnamed protein product [Rotaria sp. Silwood1]